MCCFLRLWEEGWRDRYYLYKFGVSRQLSGQKVYEEFRKQVVCRALFTINLRISPMGLIFDIFWVGAYWRGSSFIWAYDSARYMLHKKLIVKTSFPRSTKRVVEI